MSLNGLDDSKVKEAHEAAAAEPGGWFLLKYCSRDEVELLGRGSGGIVEIRNNIAQAEADSPLFGFLRYRRRNVLIKYLPEECSRLVQARVSVHFTSVCERFAPYNTTFSISDPKELKDTKLSAACSLHAASGSTSSSTSSLRRRRLMEIAEEEEEEQRASKRQSIVHEDRLEPNDEPTAVPIPPEAPLVTLNAELATSPEESKFSPSPEPPTFIGVPRPASPAKSVDDARRMSSQSTRPDIYSYASYTYGKPKVKLGPRPSLDVSGRPRTAIGNFRPISQIPAGFKLFSKGSKKDKSRDSVSQGSRSTQATPEITFSSIPIPDIPPIPLDEDPPRPHTSSGRPTTSSGVSTKSTMGSFTTTSKQMMTPEKARLMKAMQLREKKKKLSMQPPPLPVPVIDTPAAEVAQEMPRPAEKVEEVDEHSLMPETELHKHLSMSKADSGIGLDGSSLSVHTDQASEVTQSDSHPASPIIASSEPDHSTKASSLSESTDETVKEPQDELLEDPDRDDIVEEIPEGRPDSPVFTEDDTADQVASEEPAVLELTKDADMMPSPPLASVATEPVEEVSETGHEAPSQESIEPEEERGVMLPATTFVPSTPSPDRTTQELFSMRTQVETKPIEWTEGVTPLEQSRVEVTPKSPTSPGLKIPKSKFSTQDVSPKGSPSLPLAALPTIISPESHSIFEDVKALSVHGEDAPEADSSSVHSRLSKRLAAIEPIRTDVDALEKERSDPNLSDDDDLMEELQSATVEQAKPMTVSKSPITPVFPLQQTHSGANTPHAIRTVSNPLRGNLLAPGDVSQGSARSISSGAAFLHKITQQSSNSNLAAKKTNLGSSISQRIKALEKLSGSPSAPGDSAARASNAPSSTFFSVRKSSVREPSRSPSLVERASLLRKNSPPPMPSSDSRESSPEASKIPRERSGSVASRLSMFESPGNNPPRGRPESIQVTARIVRDPNQLRPGELLKDAEFGRLDLKVSPLVVDHQRAEPPPMPISNPKPVDAPKETIQERRMSKEKRRSESQDRSKEENDTKPRRSSLSIVKDFIKDRRKSLTSASLDALVVPSPMTPSRSPSRPPSTHHNSASAFPRRLSISSRRSSISKETSTGGAMSPSVLTETSGSGDEGKSTNGDKKKGRTGRFMRRLSSSLSNSRGKNLTPTGISPTVQEEDANEIAVIRASESRGSMQQPSIVSFLGDVNVQFPDNLLWKRRSMCLDSQGFLILSAVAATATPKDKQPAGAGVKRYHLSDFRSPYTPDVEVQELPNSVVLDFVDGSGLQIACEDRAGQMSVLHILQDAHQSHTSFGL